MVESPRPEGRARPVHVDAEVAENRSESGANRRLVLRVEGWPEFGPGQFAMLSAGARDAAARSDPLLPRPMAVYRARPARDGAGGTGSTAAAVEFLFKVVGRGTRLLAEARPGQRIRLVGPLGRPFPEPAPGERAVLVGGGTGIASLYALAARLAPSAQVAVLLGAAGADDLPAGEDFAALDLELRLATEDGSRGTRGLATDLLEPILDEWEGVRVYACGPTPMMRRAAEMAAARGRPCVVSLEARMACGFGVCLGCAAPLRADGFALVCSDGPTFDAAAIDWERLP